MTPAEYRDALKSVGLSLAGASKFFQTNERTTRRWAADDSDHEVPRAVAITLTLMRKYGLTPSEVVDLMDEEERKISESPAPGGTARASLRAR